MGKGLTAAMYAALVMGTLRCINKTGEDTATVLTLLNKRLLVLPITGRYCATLYALFDPITRQLTFSNAGLPHPVLVSNGRYSRLGEGGLPSAAFRETSYDKYTVRLAPGDSVLFATDGLHELRNQRDEDFSWDRLGELWCECTRKTADESLDHLFAGARSFSNGSGPHDDITAVAGSADGGRDRAERSVGRRNHRKRLRIIRRAAGLRCDFSLTCDEIRRSEF